MERTWSSLCSECTTDLRSCSQLNTHHSHTCAKDTEPQISVLFVGLEGPNEKISWSRWVDERSEETQHRDLLLSVFTLISSFSSSRLSSCRCHPNIKTAGGSAFTLLPHQHGRGLVARQRPTGRKQRRRLLGWSCCQAATAGHQ